MNKFPLYAPAVLRIGISLVFLWFGTSQLQNPGTWTNIVPSWAVGLSGLDAKTIVLANGGFEILAGGMLILGFLTRYVAALLFLHLAVITLSIGINPVGVRDFGLSLATLSIALHGKDLLCLKINSKNNDSPIKTDS